MIHGHIHNDTTMDYWPMLVARDRVLNAGADVNNFEPVTFEELLINNQQFKATNNAQSAVLTQELCKMLQEVQKLTDAAYQQYSMMANRICKGAIPSEENVEQVLDGLLDFCNEERFVVLYKNICRTVLIQYPQLVQDHIRLFLEQYGAEGAADHAYRDGV